MTTMNNILKIFGETATPKKIVADPDKYTAGQGGNLDTSITNIINWIIGVVGLVAVVVVIIGGVTYMTSNGDPGKVKKAKDTILYGVIGLVICVLAFAIVNFVISGALA